MIAKLKVLIVEDDFLIADMTEEILVGHGYDVCGIAGAVEDAVALGRLHKPELALIDFRLAAGGLGTEVARQLKLICAPGILYATGNNAQVAIHNTDGHECIGKPYRAADLLRSLEIVFDLVSTGIAMPPFPYGFQLLEIAVVAEPEVFDG